MFLLRVFILCIAISITFHVEVFADQVGSESGNTSEKYITLGEKNIFSNFMENLIGSGEVIHKEKDEKIGKKGNTRIKLEKKQKEEKEEDSENTTLIEKAIQKALIEMMKDDGKKWLTEIDKSFKKIKSNPDDVLYTYTDLQGKFRQIQSDIEEQGLSDSVKGKIILPYCDYMIENIEKKKKSLITP